MFLLLRCYAVRNKRNRKAAWPTADSTLCNGVVMIWQVKSDVFKEEACAVSEWEALIYAHLLLRSASRLRDCKHAVVVFQETPRTWFSGSLERKHAAPHDTKVNSGVIKFEGRAVYQAKVTWWAASEIPSAQFLRWRKESQLLCTVLAPHNCIWCILHSFTIYVISMLWIPASYFRFCVSVSCFLYHTSSLVYS